MGCCKRVQHAYQPYPQIGLLAKNINPTLKNLQQQIGTGLDHIYCYIVKSVKNKNSFLQQQGCGPNWQGGLITLCTCKHFMRTFLDLESWKGTWIAGFTTADAGNGSNAIVYLMRVEKAFDSHHDMWYALPNETRWAKDAHRKGNVFGDIYRPKSKLTDDKKFSADSYYEPCDSHAHGQDNGWHNDLDYSHYKRHAALLLGEEKNSFLWSKPTIKAKFRLHRGQKKMLLADLYNLLCEE